MAEPHTGEPASAVSETREQTAAAERQQLSWADTLASAPAVLRAGLVGGQRLLAAAASTTMLVSRSAVGTMGAGSSGPIGAFRTSVLGALREALGIDELEAELRRLGGHPTPDAAATDEPTEPPATPSLQERGRRLLEQSTALEPDGEHPSFGLVLEQIAPDEMRLLRVLARDGDQAAVDVETGGVLSGGSRVVARRVTMLAATAGCKHPDRLAVYLDNLERLGIVHLGDEPLDDGGYEVVEAQPVVAEARAQASQGASRARLVRRRLGLTDFGSAFCRACVPG